MALAGIALSSPSFTHARSAKKIRLGFIGVGLRGRAHVESALMIPDVAIPAICDIDREAVAETQKILRKAGLPEAKSYVSGEHDFENLVRRDDLDGIVISTPWHWHVPMAVAVMKAGKYAGLEVPASITVEETWELVNVHELTGSHCMILENACYRRDILAILNMVRENKLGELIQLECGYLHDLRHVKFNNGKQPYGGGVEFGEKGYSEARWRTQHSIDRNGDLYPTHGLGPMAEMVNINRGNQFDYLVSMATKSRGLHNYIVENGGDDHPNAAISFKLGDVVRTMIKCVNGETITVVHDTNLPRPYSLGYTIQGTKGIWRYKNEYEPNEIYIEDETKDHKWESFEPYLHQYDHRLWKKHGVEAVRTGHDGIDYFVIKEFVDAIREQVAPPMDVYDAAAWSVIGPLSEKSISQGSTPVKIPDFTKGKWKSRKPVFAL